MLNTMAAMQDAHNTQVHPQWRTAEFAYYRAVWVECAELLEHYGWKWWKHQQPDLWQVKLELVDIWHFGMSDLLRSNALAPELLDILDVSPAVDADAGRLRLAVEELACQTLTSRSFAVPAFARVMELLPLPFDALFHLYVGKNVLNSFRQNHGYQAGTYIKVWDRREDNEHLIELLDGLESLETAEEQQHLYGLLEARYPGGPVPDNDD